MMHSHLIPPSIKPHLRRSRSQTSPSSTRAPLDLHGEASPFPVFPAHNIDGAGDFVATPSHQTSVQPPSVQPTPRASIESQRHSRIPHLHLHTHILPGTHGHHHGATQAKANTNTNGTTKSTDAASKPSTNGPRPSSPTLRKAYLPHEPWGTINTSNDDIQLRRTLSYRPSRPDKDRAPANYASSSRDHHLLSPTNFDPASGLYPAPAYTIRNRPRAISDSSRPHLHHEPIDNAANTTGISNAVVLALDRGDQRKEDKIRSSTSKDVEKISHEAKLAEDEMRRRLTAVERSGMEITRRLDYTYYNLLEKLGGLVGVVESLQSLRSQVLDLGSKLDSDTKVVGNEIGNSILHLRDGVDGRRQERVERLEQRMKDGRERARQLADRLETARTKLAEWEKGELEWRETVSWRLRIIWVIGALIVATCVIVAGARSWRTSEKTMSEMGLGADMCLGVDEGSEGWLKDLRKATTVTSGGDGNNNGTDLQERMRSVYIPEDVVELLKSAGVPSKLTTPISHPSLEMNSVDAETSHATKPAPHSSLDAAARSQNKHDRPSDTHAKEATSHGQVGLNENSEDEIDIQDSRLLGFDEL